MLTFGFVYGLYTVIVGVVKLYSKWKKEKEEKQRSTRLYIHKKVYNRLAFPCVERILCIVVGRRGIWWFEHIVIVCIVLGSDHLKMYKVEQNIAHDELWNRTRFFFFLLAFIRSRS